MNDLDDLDFKIYRISWKDIESGSKAIADHIADEYEIDALVCKQEDVLPAELVARELGLPLTIVHPESRHGGVIVDCIPRFGKPIRSGEYHQPYPKIAIVTTMVDDKHNVDDLINIYKNNNPISMAIYSRANAPTPPTYKWVMIAKAVNCVFPWEKA